MTITIKLLLICLVLTNYAIGQNINDYTAPTPNHILVKGTNIAMIPPKDFSISPNFKGFQNTQDPTSMIMIMDIPAPFSEISKGFNKEMLASKGMILNAKKEVVINNFKGFLIEVEQNASGLIFLKTILVYGDSAFTSMINGVYLKDSTENGARIKQSILTTIVNQSLIIDTRKELDYTLDETVGGLKFKSVIGNGMLFNRDLKTPTESEDKATLITDKSFAKTEIADKKLFCISRIKKYPTDYQMIIAKGITEIELDGVKGYALYAKNTEDESEEMYQVIIFQDDGGYFIFGGTYLKGEEKAENYIKKVIETFKRK